MTRLVIGMQKPERRDDAGRLHFGNRLDDRVDRAGRNRDRIGALHVRVLAQGQPARRCTEPAHRAHVFVAPHGHGVVARLKAALRVVLVERIGIGLGRRCEQRGDGRAGMREQQRTARKHRVVEMRRDHQKAIEAAGFLESPHGRQTYAGAAADNASRPVRSSFSLGQPKPRRKCRSSSSNQWPGPT